MGAILNLGIDRSTIGDICVEGKCAYVFCTSAMSVFLQETLEQVRHTKVRCVPVKELEALPEKKLSYREEHVASLRRNCERGLETVAQPGADAFFTEKGLCQREVDGKRQPDVKGRGHGIGQRFRKIYFPG